MRKDTLYLTLSRDITSYTITSGQRAIATNVNYAVTIESPTLTTNLAGRDVSLIISDTDGNTLTTATTFYPDTKNPYKAVTGSLLLDGGVYGKFFDGKPVDTAVRLPIMIRDKSATLLSSDIVIVNGGEVAEPSASDETVAGLVNAIRFYDLAEFKAWLDGVKERPDGLKPTDIVVGQWVHTQQDGSFICKELIGAEPSVAKNFTAIVTQFPLTGTLKMNPDNGIGLSVYSGDVYNDDEATSFSVDAITYKGDAFTFTAGDNQVARQKDNYALENRVNSTMKSTLDAVKADNDKTYAAMLPVRNETVGARDRAETAARGAKASEARAITAEENAATSEQNAEASKKSAAVSEANAGLYRQQALAYAQKAETEATTSATKATEASTSASEASVSAGEALAHKNDAGSYAEASRLSAEASAGSAESSAASAAASKSSAETAAQSESIAVGSAAAAASSESTASQYKDTAVSAASLAVTSKDSASNFADAASASAAAAAKSAAASASSASAAKQSATDLAEAVATANSLDGRISAIENGVGIYRADNGKIYTYKPFYTDTGKGDGTLAIAYEHDLYKVVAPVEDVAAKAERYVVPGHDGVYYAFFRGWLSGNSGPHRLYLYDDNLKRVFATEYFTGGYTALGTLGESSITSSYVVFDGRVYVRQKNLAYWRIYDLASQKLLSSVNLGEPFGSLCHNPKTGHLLFMTASVAYLVDENLAFVTDENGEKVTVAYPEEVTSTSGVGYWWCHRLFCGWTFLWNHTCQFMLRLDSDAEGNDVFSVCRECLCVNGEDGKVDHEVDENGSPVKDSISTAVCVPKNTSEGGIIPFHKSGSQVFSSGTIAVNYGPPVFNDMRNPRNMSRRYLGIIYNGVEQYVLLSDGRLLSLQQMNLDTWNFVNQEWKYNGVFTALESKKKPAKYVDDKHYLIPLAPQNMSVSGYADCSTPHYIAANAGEINAFNVRNAEASYGLNSVTINPINIGNNARSGYSDYMRDGVFVGPGCVYLTDNKTFYHRFF